MDHDLKAWTMIQKHGPLFKGMDHDSKAWTMIQRHGPRFVVLNLVSQFKMQVICMSLYNLCEYKENCNTYKLLGDHATHPNSPRIPALPKQLMLRFLSSVV